MESSPTLIVIIPSTPPSCVTITKKLSKKGVEKPFIVCKIFSSNQRCSPSSTSSAICTNPVTKIINSTKYRLKLKLRCDDIYENIFCIVIIVPK